MEHYIEEGMKQFQQEVDQKMSKLISELKPYLLTDTVNLNVKRNELIFNVYSMSIQFNEQIDNTKANYKDLPDLLNPALNNIKDQFQLYLATNRFNLDNYIVGMKIELIN